MMQASCTKSQQCVLIWEASWRGTIQKKRGTVLVTDHDSTSLGMWSMGRLYRIYPPLETRRHNKATKLIRFILSNIDQPLSWFIRHTVTVN